MSVMEDITEVVECVCHQMASRNGSSPDDVCKVIMSSQRTFQEALNRTNCTVYDNLLQYPVSEEPSPYPEQIAMSVLFSVVMVAGLIGNTLVIYVVVKHGITRSITNLYFISLAVADFIYLLFCIPLTIAAFVLPNWPFGPLTCKLVNYLYIVAMGTSVFTMAAMAVDRYQAVVKHVQARVSRTVRRTTIRLLGIWFLNMVLCSPALLIHQVHTYTRMEGEQHFCMEFYPRVWHRTTYILFMFLIYYVIPLGLIAVCYLLMARHLSLHVQIREPARSRNRKVSKILLVVVTTFAVCWLPIHIIYIIRDWVGVHNLANYISKFIAQFLTYLNSCLNPVIYSFMSDSFRQCFRETLDCLPQGSHKSVPAIRAPPSLAFDRAFTPVSGTPTPSPALSNPDHDMTRPFPDKSNSSNSDSNTSRLTMTTIVEFSNEANARVRLADFTISSA